MEISLHVKCLVLHIYVLNVNTKYAPKNKTDAGSTVQLGGEMQGTDSNLDSLLLFLLL